MVQKIDHVGIAVKNLGEAIKFYEQTLGLKIEGQEIILDQKVKTAFIPLGESRIELLESLDPEGPVGKFIASRGEGIHHIALRVSDLEADLQSLKENGVKLIDEKPRRGAHKLRIAFIHPKATNGVLLELCQSEKPR